jgi:2,6-dihydroxypyridine 3-monooxygenase
MTVRAAVVGGSLGGVVAAVALRAAGFEAVVLERSPTPLAGRGAGISLRPIMVELLQRKGDIDLDRICTRVVRTRYYGPGGTLRGEAVHDARFTSWDTLHRRLLAEAPAEAYRFGAEVVGVESDRAVLQLADGSAALADLVVFADGTSSTGRRLLAPASEPVYAGYVCWRGVVPEMAMDAAARALLDDATNIVLLEPGYFGAYPIPGPDGSVAPGERLYNWVWYRNVAPGADFTELMTDSDGVYRFSSVPPGRVRAPHVAGLHAEAARLPPVLRDLVRATERPFIQTICDVEVPRMVFGRACLIGDAAFGGRPHLGAGTAKAALDACTLADAIGDHAGDIPAALAEWEPRQVAVGRAFVADNRRLGEQFQFSAAPVPITPALRPGWAG